MQTKSNWFNLLDDQNSVYKIKMMSDDKGRKRWSQRRMVVSMAGHSHNGFMITMVDDDDKRG